MDPVASLPDQDWVDALSDVPGVELVTWDMEDAPPRDDIALAVPPYMRAGRRQLGHLQQCPQLRAVQLVTAGYEHVQPHLPEGVQLANGAGIHDTSTAELAVALALASLRGIPEATRAGEQGRWTSLNGRRSLADRHVLILGYGSIGTAIARRLQPFEVSLTAVASRARAGDELVDTIHGTDELPDLLPHHDVVIVVVPLSEATRRMVDADFLHALPDGALVVNVARGGVVDTDALVRECAAGRLTAALDVTDPEPLPDGHPVWTTPGMLVTPHVGGATTAFVPRALDFLRRELTRFGKGEDLSHVVATG
ncbi:2-hydroxyacid dehydrogenase [Allobranchiibius huperziae]|uniref:Phosphoglycerate dehydrogenase-like enzyme n=1 Tax=Allobranchiibius huperziae TaxID=1874116 RepID=A0A853DKY0_9MICO|nr:2-hydroxyacid dehydrogenase [Allobranchiibius huperziae]NYJ75330.1 phosphoglycerate dehydrogenase-like enzyme [Allobranchiibius huperziae]